MAMNYSIPIEGLHARTGTERATLVRRTYSLVLLGVILTVAGTAFAFTQPALLAAVNAHPFITLLCGFVPLILATRARATFPANILLVLLFTFTMGVMISPVMFFYTQTQPQLLPQAGLLTLSTFGVLTAYAWLSKRDFSAFGSFFVVGLWVLIATSLMNLFFQNETAALWISAATLLVFSGLLIFDTWRLKNVYGPDQYVLAAVQIYLDLLNMFMAILHLLGRRD